MIAVVDKKQEAVFIPSLVCWWRLIACRYIRTFVPSYFFQPNLYSTPMIAKCCRIS